MKQWTGSVSADCGARPWVEMCIRDSKNGILLELTGAEYKLLCFFMQHPNAVLSKEQILEDVYKRQVFLQGQNILRNEQTVQKFQPLGRCGGIGLIFHGEPVQAEFLFMKKPSGNLALFKQ